MKITRLYLKITHPYPIREILTYFLIAVLLCTFVFMMGKTVMLTELLEIYREFSISFACIVFGLMVIPLGVQPRRSGKSYEFILGIFVVMGYYVLLTSAETFAYNGMLPPLTASWAPNLILIAIGIYLLVKTANESPIEILHRLDQIVGSITLKIKKISKTI
jgi:lipopolysaccharide export system permease protein